MRRQRGMTLIELMIVVVVVAILAAISIPSYRQYVIRSNRASGKALLLSSAQRLERCFTRSNTYEDCVKPDGTDILPETTADGTYVVSYAAGSPTPTTYTIQAVPQGAQAADAECATFSVDELGDQDVSGTLTATPQQCWGR